MASETFLRLLLRDTQLDATSRQLLLDYGHMDTLAKVELLNVLRGV